MQADRNRTDDPFLDVTGSDLEGVGGQERPEEKPRPNGTIEAEELSFRANPVPAVEAALPNRMRFTAILAGAVAVIAVLIFIILNRDTWFGQGSKPGDMVEPIAGTVDLPPASTSPQPTGIPGTEERGISGRTPSQTKMPTPSPSPATSRDQGSSSPTEEATEDVLAPVLPPDPIEVLERQVAEKEKKVEELEGELAAARKDTKRQESKAKAEAEKRRKRDGEFRALSKDFETFKSKAQDRETGLGNRIRSLEGQLAERSTELSEEKKSNVALQGENDSLKEQLSILRRENRILEKKTDLQESLLSDEKTATSQLVSRLQRYQADLEEQREATATAERKASDLQARLDSTLKELAHEKQKVYPGQVVPMSDPELIAPERIKQTTPKYPTAARRNGIQGEVQLRILISETGEVIRTEVVKAPPGGEMLVEAAQDAVRKWVYNPGIKKGVKVQTWKTIGIQFSP